jgi:pimeloyl-ACP methyl ester carboxylesterase
MRTQAKPRMGGVLAALVLAFAVAIAMGIGYEQVERQRERERLPQVGRSVDIGGRTLNLYCSGEGSPAVILESNTFAPGYSWVFIQREIAKVTLACWYDRAGYGWSESAPPPHTSTASAMDLHKLLRGAGLPPPYLLVGDGFGNFNVRVYNGLYPGDVAGMVLVDPIVEQEERMGMASRVPFHLGYPPDLVLRTVSRIGLMRLLHHSKPRDLPPVGLTPGEWATLSGLEREPKLRAAFLAEQGFSASLGEVRSSGGLGNRPLLVLRSEDSPADPDEETARLTRLSSQGRQMVVKGSGRRIQSEAPEAVIEAVRGIVEALRR